MRVVNLIGVIAGLAAAWFLAWPGSPSLIQASPSAVSSAVAPQAQTAYVFNVVAEDEAAMLDLLARAEALAKQPSLAGDKAKIALVLHGPEVTLFRRNEYARHMGLVDVAARLDSQNLVEVKMCKRQMRAHDMDANDIPSFIEVVDFGPDEVRRLKGQGYIEI